MLMFVQKNHCDLSVLSEAGQQGSNGYIPRVGMQPSPIEFTAGPVEMEAQPDEESEDDDEEEEEVVTETGQSSDAVVSEKLRRDVTEDELPPQIVSRFDSRQKRSGFIDVWWLFDDGGMLWNLAALFA